MGIQQIVHLLSLMQQNPILDTFYVGTSSHNLCNASLNVVTSTFVCYVAG